MPITDPWDIKTDDERQVDVLNTFIIFCEDQNCEPIYFRSFSTDKIKIITIPEQGSRRLNLQNTIAKCKEDKFLEFRDGLWQLTPGIEEKIWCVYDRDMEHADWASISQTDHLAFDISISSAASTGLKVAWSNDAFELWVLLHFEDVATNAIIHRDYIYERLTDIFITLGQGNLELGQITNHLKFNYRYAFKKRQNFINHVLPILKNNIAAATVRADHLAAQFNAQVPFHQRNPCTMVHQLVQEIVG